MEEKRDKSGLTEQEALARYRAKNYPRPYLTADVVLFRGQGDDTELLLVRRGGHPFIGCWALPGGFANENEPLEETAARELMEETGLTGLSLELLGVYSAPGRDPRGWVVSAAYVGAAGNRVQECAGDDAADAGWFRLAVVPDGDALRVCLAGGDKGDIGFVISGFRDRCAPCMCEGALAFDHATIVAQAIRKIGLI